MNGSSAVTKTNYNSYIKDIVKEAKILFNGHDRIAEKKDGFSHLRIL